MPDDETLESLRGARDLLSRELEHAHAQRGEMLDAIRVAAGLVSDAGREGGVSDEWVDAARKLLAHVASRGWAS